MRAHPRFFLLASCLAAWAAPPAARAGDALAEVRALVAAGDLAGAEAACDRVLDAAPDHLDVRVERGHLRSFRRDFTAAREDFEAVLASRPASAAALTGLGYALAWSGAYDDAERRFSAALATSFGSAEARKGLAYVALWRGDGDEAARRFAALSPGPDRDAEAAAGLGRALLAADRRAEARAVLLRARALEPGRADVRDALRAAGAGTPRVELTVLGGTSVLRGEAETGVRFAEAALAPRDDARLWVQYDDTLSLDSGLARAGERAPAFLGGGLLRYGGRHLTRLEAGWRTLPDGDGQVLARGEQVLDPGGAVALRVGGGVAVRGGARTEGAVHAGALLRSSRTLTFEPTLFYGRGGAPGDHEVRALLAATWRPTAGAELGGGVASGWTFAATRPDGAPFALFLRGGAALGPRARGHVLVGQERPAAGPAVTVVALGVTVTAGGRP